MKFSGRLPLDPRKKRLIYKKAPRRSLLLKQNMHLIQNLSIVVKKLVKTKKIELFALELSHRQKLRKVWAFSMAFPTAVFLKSVPHLLIQPCGWNIPIPSRSLNSSLLIIRNVATRTFTSQCCVKLYSITFL